MSPVKPETRSFYERAVARAAEHVVRHLDDALDLEALAATVNISPFHFHRIFRGMLGETPLELHRRLRLERAAWTLSTSRAPVTRVAFDAGYDTHEAFTRAFRARYGQAPSRFRARAAAGRAASPDGCVRPAQTELASRSALHYSPGGPGRATLPLIQEDYRMQVTLSDRPALRAAASRHGGAYNRISEAFQRLHGIAGPAGLVRPGTEMLAVYHDDPETTAEPELRSDAALTVPPDVPIPAGLAEIAIPAGRYAVTTHVGPYEQLGDAWANLMGGWLPRSGYRLGPGVTYEIYRNTPMDTRPDALRTELYLPVADEPSDEASPDDARA